MIQRKKLVDYANSKKAQALRVTIKDKNYMYLKAVEALCKCGFAIKANKQANKEAYELSKKAFDSMYQFGYEQFLNDTIQSNLAIAYIYLLGWFESYNQTLSYDKINANRNHSFTNIAGLQMIITDISTTYSQRNICNALFQIELYASVWGIDLHYYVYETLNNMEYNIKNRI